ncbi:MAG: putative quinol monooxygenase [Candidatus Binatia bacterium]
MIVIAGHVRIKPEERATAVRVALAMAEATRHESGCREYRFTTDLADPCVFHIYEEWESAEALQQHFATPHMAEFQRRLPSIVAGPASIMRYEVASATRMS